jgi:hypothetical protein
MIKDAKLLAEFEKKELRKEKSDYQNALRAARGIWKMHARSSSRTRISTGPM